MTPQESVNILLVDDQPAKLLSYKVILNELGENILEASSAREALQCLLKSEVAVILADVCMPDMDGFQLAAMVREHPRFKETAIIFISAIHLTDLDRLRGYEMGAVDYVPVPVVPEVLRAKVRVFAELYRKTRLLGAMNAELERRVAARTAELELTASQLRQSEHRRTLALIAGHMGSWDWDRTTGDWLWDEGQYRIFGVDRRCFTITLDNVRSLIHPDDWVQLCNAFEELSSEPQSLEREFRIRRPNGDVRWCLGTASPTLDDNGRVVRISGVTIDITERKQAEERQALLAREIDHRAKNVLALVQSIVSLTRADDVRCYVAAIEGRIRALSVAHTLLSLSRWQGADIVRLVHEELAPYCTNDNAKVMARGPNVTLEPAAAQSIALAVHELVTNAAKYGALSRAGGTVELSWSLSAEFLDLQWVENGVAIMVPPTACGFGTKIIRSSVEQQLGGEVTFDWRPSGLCCSLSIPFGRNSLPINLRPKDTLARTARNSPSATIVLKGNHILVVEDEALIALSLRDTLAELGFLPIGPFSRCSDALVALHRNAVDAAILDVNLGGETAYPLAEVLAAEGIPFVFLTGYRNEEIDTRFSNILVLQKPVEREDLHNIFSVPYSLAVSSTHAELALQTRAKG